MHPSSNNSLSVVVSRLWADHMWLVTWYVLCAGGRVVLDGRLELPDDMHDPDDVERLVAEKYTELLKLL